MRDPPIIVPVGTAAGIMPVQSPALENRGGDDLPRRVQPAPGDAPARFSRRIL